MRKCIATGLMISLATNAMALTGVHFQDNTDIAVSLSQTNYNRLVVKDDKITQAHFPEGTMAIKNEEDGSLYVMLATNTPFTLFVTTESGHHFSATVNGEESLGKTIEFVPQTRAPVKLAHAAAETHQTPEPPEASAIKTLLSSMVSAKPLPGFQVKKHHFAQATRLQQGLVLTPKQTFNGMTLKGEVFSIYNSSKRPIDISETWFVAEGVKAVSLTATTLVPKQSAVVYRISENANG